jgi:UTP-glucose-1-phosphate uridylyltransferase
MVVSGSPRWWRSQRKGTAPSNYFINGRYILQPEIFSRFSAKQERGAGNEIQVTDAMLKLAEDPVFLCLHGSVARLMIAGPRPGLSWPM